MKIKMVRAQRLMMVNDGGGTGGRSGGGDDSGKGKDQNGSEGDEDDEDDSDGLDGLLEEDADDDEGDDDSGDGDGSGSGGGSTDVDAVVKALTPVLQKQINSAIDRRINAVVREVRGGGKKQRKASDDGDGDGGNEDGGRKVKDAPQADVRGARMAFREYLPDEITFVSNEERTAARELGATMIRARAFDGFEDEDEVGAEVAAEVAKTITGLRKHYESRTVRALRKKGLLPDAKEGRGSMPAGKPGSKGSGYAQGASIAAQRHPKPGQK